MAYSSKFVLAVLVNGTPVKELANGEVHVPFGTTFSLRLRNRHSRNAAVKIYIDGENVGGEGYRIPANDKIDIHRYADKDATFRFVDLDSPEAVEHGKNGPNPDKIKGLIEARFYLEKSVPRVEHIHHYHPVRYPIYPDYPIRPYDYKYRYSNDASPHCSSIQPTSLCCGDAGGSTAITATFGAQKTLREGATVEGYASGQHFSKVHMDLETDYVSVKLFLKGYDGAVHSVVSECDNRPVTGAVRYCEVCGTHRKDGANFCGHCGRRY